MSLTHITSTDIRESLYFSFHSEDGGVLTLYTPKGAFNLSAAEDLMINVQINLAALQAYLNR